MPDKLYDNYVERLAKIFTAELHTIKVVYNFDYGEEYEIAVCRVLRKILPTKFGICRGFVMDLDGNKAGDDIIIFDKNRFPTIGLRDEDDFSRKEFIPVEAVYMYLEAKYTLNLSGKGGQSLFKACSQVNDAKSICDNRMDLKFEQLEEGIELPKLVTPWSNPPFRNPPWGAIICSRVRNEDGIIEDPNAIHNMLKETIIDNNYKPDLIILGESVITIPIFENQPEGGDTSSFFFISDRTSYRSFVTENIAVGVGIAQILGALDRIRLGKVSWNKVVINAIE
ncbi:DUF6602 domain-containing protein [Aquimarina algiphila]|uniref:DUF6602 domain-containing protein n=1 Tax=Aquimarina algiphila TaxID=2047982 RepID=UPI00249161E8|nr:DUF6602 domain-containing protein [Aquimarina algiphila]